MKEGGRMRRIRFIADVLMPGVKAPDHFQAGKRIMLHIIGQ
jgi:hypothetical protein